MWNTKDLKFYLGFFPRKKIKPIIYLFIYISMVQDIKTFLLMVV